MSLTVYLNDTEGSELYSRNITHNLGKMADAAGIYQILWQPDELPWIKTAKDIIPTFEKGLAELVLNKTKYSAYNSPNGWGMYEHFVTFCIDYLQACRDHPEASIYACR